MSPPLSRQQLLLRINPIRTPNTQSVYSAAQTASVCVNITGELQKIAFQPVHISIVNLHFPAKLVGLSFIHRPSEQKSGTSKVITPPPSPGTYARCCRTNGSTSVHSPLTTVGSTFFNYQSFQKFA